MPIEFWVPTRKIGLEEISTFSSKIKNRSRFCIKRLHFGGWAKGSNLRLREDNKTKGPKSKTKSVVGLSKANISFCLELRTWVDFYC